MKTACKLYQSLKCMLGNFEIQRNKTMHNKKPTLAYFFFFYFFKLPIVKLNLVFTYQEEFLLRRSGQTLEWAAQGSGGVTVPGDVQEVCRCDTEEHSVMDSISGKWTIGLDDLKGFVQP